MYKITNANIKEWAKNYDGELFDGILCDPPYELGFMGKSWDSSGIAFDTEMWTDILKLLKPGGHLLAFSGSRTYHRMAVAIEDAGFEIRDQLIWMYGSGFPKSLNIGKAVDKIQGNKREVTRVRTDGNKGGGANTYDDDNYVWDKPFDETKGTSEWEGYGTALKPAHEPCVLARKPIEGTVANNVLKHGTGGLNIDGTRVEGKPWASVAPNKGGRSGGVMGKQTTHPGGEPNTLGRFPANLIHDGSDEVEAVFPQTKNGGGNSTSKRETWLRQETEPTQYAGDKGSASRFFYCAKSSKSERNAGLDELPDMLLAHSNQAKAELKRGNTDFAREVDTSSFNSVKMLKNHHPTVKPLSLTKYLATLIKPPTGGRLLVPFSGSGSEMIGALQAGWGYVEGVELTEEYIPIAEARLAHWIDHEKSWTPQT